MLCQATFQHFLKVHGDVNVICLPTKKQKEIHEDMSGPFVLSTIFVMLGDFVVSRSRL